MTRSTPRLSPVRTLVTTVCCASLLSSAALAQGRPAGAFEAADPSNFKEDLSGIPFLVGAYALIWLVLMVYVFLLRRRTDNVVKEVALLRAQIEAASRGPSTGASAGRRCSPPGPGTRCPPRCG